MRKRYQWHWRVAQRSTPIQRIARGLQIALNVEVRVPGRNPALSPKVILTPRSEW